MHSSYCPRPAHWPESVLSLQSLPRAARPSTPELRVNLHGFSLHALRTAIENPPVIIKILSHLGLQSRAPPRASGFRYYSPSAICHLRSESIYSKRSEEPKTACQRKPTAPLALSSSERRHKEPFARLPTALRPSRPVQQWVFHQAEKELTSLPVLRYGSGHRKGRLKILSISSMCDCETWPPNLRPASHDIATHRPDSATLPMTGDAPATVPVVYFVMHALALLKMPAG